MPVSIELCLNEGTDNKQKKESTAYMLEGPECWGEGLGAGGICGGRWFGQSEEGEQEEMQLDRQRGASQLGSGRFLNGLWFSPGGWEGWVASDDFDQKSDTIWLPFFTLFLFTHFPKMLEVSSKLLKYRIDVLPILCILILECRISLDLFRSFKTLCFEVFSVQVLYILCQIYP